jgi:MFS family permease
MTTISYPDITSRAHAFGVISAMAGLGSASGPLIGGLLTTTISWRASFGAEVIVIAWILLLSRRIRESRPKELRPKLDRLGAILSGAGLVIFVLGILQAGHYGWLKARRDFSIGNVVLIQKGGLSPIVLFVVFGLLILVAFIFHLRSMERAGNEPLLPTRLFRNLTAMIGLVTQNIQWLILIGTFFVISVYLQVGRELSAVKTGIVLTPTTIGLLLSSSRAKALARKYSQRRLIATGFVATIAGMSINLLLVRATVSILRLIPGLFLIGAGVGIMLTASVNVVQSSVSQNDQGEISGLSRSISNLGSSLGIAIAGSILLSLLVSGFNSGVNASKILNEAQKQQLTAVEEISPINDTQVGAALKGQEPTVVKEVTRINAQVRNHALAMAQLAMALIGLIGLTAALLLPADPAGKTRQRRTT